ncbi:phosphodiester glycosidase family protein [Paraflavitalea sp. CAU 1676]|uniref:phosphodiester glycosidase family protein n=1 Tax=Paraflavitalea sp. CAU 1676 TaxID=3032598 RepID=UPI0023DB7962|nr:phosphodiester glycosidase family protein [Paraflavitalea sp. CAU 1676]MDF2190387.1 phosphodiester glycosidase family protein [Paraflavitalea sp. CAU 1676]
MKRLNTLILLLIAITVSTSFIKPPAEDERFIYCIVDPQKQDLLFYWKDDQGKILGSIQRLKDHVEGKSQQLVFAMNGGMYQEDGTPVGLYIQEQKTLKKINKANASGNFYMKPNGILYVSTDGKASICRTEDFINNGKIKYATQSGPMLLIDGKHHSAFTKGSININIRNGVGILPGNKLLFAMSKGGVNFYDFAEFFKQQGCLNALYLDGFVSRTYLPEQNCLQTDGNFGVIIGVVKPK